MKRNRLRRAFFASGMLALGLIGCELIVSSTAPDFRCTPGAAGACPEGQSCDPRSFVCVPSGAVSETGPSETSTIKDGGTDGKIPIVEDGAAQLGERCDENIACSLGLLCGTSNTLTTTIVSSGSTGSFCTKTCCTSADCADGFVCFGAGTGGNYCVSAKLAQRETPGAKGPGETCGAGTDCRSGLCTEGHCTDTCCSDVECATGTVCRVKVVEVPPPKRENWVCAPAEGDASLSAGKRCDGTFERCKNDNCTGLPVQCRPTCCNTQQCLAISPTFRFCAYGEFTTTSSQTKWCFGDAGAGPKGLGAECSGNLECAHRFCDPDTKRCGSVCCQDSDCADGGACRPVGTGTPFLRCVPAAVPQ